MSYSALEYTLIHMSLETNTAEKLDTPSLRGSTLCNWIRNVFQLQLDGVHAYVLDAVFVGQLRLILVHEVPCWVYDKH